MHTNNILFKNLALAVIFCALATAGRAQLSESEKFKKREKYTSNAILINPSYIAQFPFANMKDRFGFNSNISMLIGFRTAYHITAGIEGSYFFGNKVKENQILNQLLTDEGMVITNEGKQISPRISEEGFSVKAVVEKLFPVAKKLKNSGIYFNGGVGFIQHRILIRVPTRLVPQLDKTYRKGYDRMSNGALISFGTGFKFVEQKKLLSFNIGFQADIGFTQNRRPWNFDEGRKDNTQRVDIFLGAKIGWIIPIQLNKDNVAQY